MKILKEINAIMSEIGAIGKDHRNAEQNYKFRAIDDIVAKLNPILVKHSVVIVPTESDSTSVTITTKTRNGERSAVHATATIKYTIYADDGSTVIAVGTGEGIDYSDKAINKASTGAYKNMLCQTFVIPTYEKQDSEYESLAPPHNRKADLIGEMGRMAKELSPSEKLTVKGMIEEAGLEAYRDGTEEQLESINEKVRNLLSDEAHKAIFG